jgi:hypothetical protein
MPWQIPKCPLWVIHAVSAVVAIGGIPDIPASLFNSRPELAEMKLYPARPITL